MRVIRAEDMKEGRWRNGMGVSWDIAASPDDAAADFGWRFALARIDRDVPFSRYPGVDRYFTLVEGGGLDLDFAGGRRIAVDTPFVPHFYACDVDTFCRVRGGPCRALNLFLRRGVWQADVEVVSGDRRIDHAGPVLLFALDGEATADGARLRPGDAAVAQGHLRVTGNAGHLYVARLSG